MRFLAQHNLSEEIFEIETPRNDFSPQPNGSERSTGHKTPEGLRRDESVKQHFPHSLLDRGLPWPDE